MRPIALVSGDHHFDERSPRWSECLRIHDWMVDQVRELKPQVFISCGDIYERESTPREREAVAWWITRIAAECPVLIVRGNHDARLDCTILGRLRAYNDIRVEEGAAVHALNGVSIAACAWPSRASIAAMSGNLGAGVDVAAHEAMTSVIRGLGNELAGLNGPRIFAMHAMVDGSKTSVGQPLIGAEMRIPLDVLALAQADAVVLGHIHAPQHWRHGDTQITYCGSPFRTSFGEVEEKSIVALYQDDASGTVVTKRIPTPAARMVLAEGVFDGEAMAGQIDLQGLAAGDEARFRYKVRADHRDAAKRALTLLRHQAETQGVRLKIEEDVTPVTRAKAPEIASANSIADKLDVLWKTRGTVPTPEYRACLIEKLSTLTG